MPANFNNFTTGTSIGNNDHVVGFSAASAGGERKWTLATLRAAITAGLPTTAPSPVQVRVAASVNRATGAQYGGLWFNVRSVTDQSAPRDGKNKTINFNTPLPNANYLVFVNSLGGNAKPTTALNYETRAWGKAADRVNVFHTNESYLDREPAFDVVIFQ